MELNTRNHPTMLVAALFVGFRYSLSFFTKQRTEPSSHHLVHRAPGVLVHLLPYLNVFPMLISIGLTYSCRHKELAKPEFPVSSKSRAAAAGSELDKINDELAHLQRIVDDFSKDNNKTSEDHPDFSQLLQQVKGLTPEDIHTQIKDGRFAKAIDNIRKIDELQQKISALETKVGSVPPENHTKADPSLLNGTGVFLIVMGSLVSFRGLQKTFLPKTGVRLTNALQMLTQAGLGLVPILIGAMILSDETPSTELVLGSQIIMASTGSVAILGAAKNLYDLISNQGSEELARLQEAAPHRDGASSAEEQKLGEKGGDTRGGVRAKGAPEGAGSKEKRTDSMGSTKKTATLGFLSTAVYAVLGAGMIAWSSQLSLAESKEADPKDRLLSEIKNSFMRFAEIEKANPSP